MLESQIQDFNKRMKLYRKIESFEWFLRNHKKYLIVFDGADDEAAKAEVEKYVKGAKGKILTTSRLA